MRRSAALLAMVFTILVAAAAPASTVAAVDTSPSREVTAPFSGLSFFELGTHGCVFVFEIYDLTFQTARHRSGTVHIDGCVSEASVTGGFAFESGGTFTLTTEKDATLTGTVSGGLFPIDLTLTVTGGTKTFRRVSGTIAVDGIGGPAGPISGTLTASLHR